ncbi:MAG: hypothetical protein JST26_13345 [Bacteroidetes bacterium]|nr:hypothetical protein [Bacteroidota bacterium]
MKKTVVTGMALALGLLKLNAQVTIVDPSTFSGHYYTEKNIVIEDGYSKKKKTELDLVWNAENGSLTGTVQGFESKSDKIVFFTESTQKNWAAKSKIWVFKSSNMNDNYYGKDMFTSSGSEIETGMFIEDGVFVLFDYTGGVDQNVKTFDVENDVNNVRIFAKDKSKLSMDKQEILKKADAMINAAGGEQMKKQLDAQRKADFAFPKETLSKTDKALKKEVVEFFTNMEMPADDNSTFICAYTVSPDWAIIRNTTTGVILGREIVVEMVRKGNISGKCRRFPYLLYAQYNGSGYGKLMFKKKWDIVECDCAEAEKNK